MTPDHLSPDTPLRLDYRKPAMTPLAYRPKDAAAMIGVRKTKFWEIVKAGRLPTRKLGTKTTVVMRDDLLTYLAEHPNPREEGAELRRERAELRRAAQAGAPRHGVPGTVYIVRCGRHVKIGFTRGLTEERVSALQTGAPERIVVLRELKACSLTEELLHNRFNQYRSTGEWFRYKGELASWVGAGCPLPPGRHPNNYPSTRWWIDPAKPEPARTKTPSHERVARANKSQPEP